MYYKRKKDVCATNPLKSTLGDGKVNLMIAQHTTMRDTPEDGV
jgi:hypothetical protein